MTARRRGPEWPRRLAVFLISPRRVPPLPRALGDCPGDGGRRCRARLGRTGRSARPVRPAALRLIADLFWWMAVGSAAVWLAAVGFLLYCLWPPRRPVAPQVEKRIVADGGVVLPTVLLAVLVGNALPPLTGLVDAPPVGEAADLRVRVTGEQWWWRVQYPGAADGVVELANEVRLPLGQRAHLELASDNVVHAFWVPSLAGKVDMVPGRTTDLTLEPTRLGTFRGLCAEYAARRTHEWRSRWW